MSAARVLLGVVLCGAQMFLVSPGAGAQVSGPAVMRRALPVAEDLALWGSPSPTGWTVDAGLRSRIAPPPAGSTTASMAPTALSLLIPGVGQHLLGQRRKWGYLALETVGWVVYFERRAAGGRLRSEYRDLAWETARSRLGPREDGGFGYYETMSRWTRSGLYDRDPVAPGVQPEEDTAAYNGAVWALARQIYLPPGTPEGPASVPYQRALAYYSERAWGDAFLWDWGGSGEARAEFTGLIRESDDRIRQATTALGVVLANHLLAAADAWVSSRQDRVRAEASFIPSGGGATVAWAFRLQGSFAP